MKKLFIAAAFLLSSSAIFAQTKFGIKGGVNFANQEWKSSGISISPSSVTSFHIQGLADLPVNESISIQPGLGISGRGFKLSSDGASVTSNLVYLDLPINAVVKFPVASIGKFFIGAGPYASYGLGGKEKSKGFNFFDDEQTETKTDAFGKDGSYKRADFGANFLGGVELKNGLLLNVNYGLGLLNIVKSTNENEEDEFISEEDSDVTFKNKVFSISVGFLF